MTELKDLLIKAAVRTCFLMTGQERSSQQIRHSLAEYLDLARHVGPDAGRCPVRVPPMLGLDEDMLDWSLFMILEHNTIVNRAITRTVQALCLGERPPELDMKGDVMPSSDPGSEQVPAFKESVDQHLDLVAGLTGLRRTPSHRHTLFGELTGHGWHCMLGFHLEIHLRQAKAGARRLSAGPNSEA